MTMNKTIDDYRKLDKKGYVYNENPLGRITVYEILLKLGVPGEMLNFNSIEVPEGYLLTHECKNRRSHYLELCLKVSLESKKKSGSVYKVKSIINKNQILAGRSSTGNVYFYNDIIDIVKNYLEKNPIETWIQNKIKVKSNSKSVKCDICDTEVKNYTAHCKSKKHQNNLIEYEYSDSDSDTS